MKKMLISIVSAFLIGFLLSGFTIYSLKQSFSLFEEKNTVTAFQVGVYKSKENAELMLSQYPGSISVKDGDYYRVYIGVAKDKTCEQLLEAYFLNSNINVYRKEIEVTKEFVKEMDLYESKASKDDMQIFEKLNQEMMKKLQGEIL